MTEERPFVELAELCSRTCRVLQAIDDLGGISETTEDLGRCVGLTQPFLLVLMSDIGSCAALSQGSENGVIVLAVYGSKTSSRSKNASSRGGRSCVKS